MSKTFKSVAFTLLSLGVALTASTAWANDSAIIQDSYKRSEIEGIGNTSVQESIQRSTDTRVGNTRGNSGTSMIDTQESSSYGYDNHNRQRSVQDTEHNRIDLGRPSH